MLTIETCISYLSDNNFTDIEFSHEQNKNLYFTSFDYEQGKSCIVEFEQEESKILVSAKYSNDTYFTIFESFSLED